MVEQSEILTKSRRLLFRQLIRLDCNVQMSYFFPFFHSLFGLVTKGLRIVSTDPFGNFSIWKTIYIYILAWLGGVGRRGIGNGANGYDGWRICNTSEFFVLSVINIKYFLNNKKIEAETSTDLKKVKKEVYIYIVKEYRARAKLKLKFTRIFPKVSRNVQ